MPTPAPEAARAFRAALLRRERQRAVRLVRAYGTIWRDLKREIDALVDQVWELQPTNPNRILRLERYQRLRRQIIQEMERWGDYAAIEIDGAVVEEIARAQQEARRLVRGAFPPELRAAIMGEWTTLPVEQITSIIGMTDPMSALRLGMVEQLGPEIAKGVADELVSGVALGRGPRKVASLIRQKFGLGLDWSLRNARTAQMYAAREASRASYMANDDICKGWIWHAELADRTCPMCIALHGTFHAFEERLNDHYNGRCVATPATKTYRELGIPVDEPEVKWVDGEEWLRDQHTHTQDEILGIGKAEAWRDGQFSLRDLIGERDDPAYGPMISIKSLASVLGI